ncbi:MCE family protein [Mycolicibacterium sp. HS_4_1]
MSAGAAYTGRLRPAWWSAILLVVLTAWVLVTAGLFNGTIRSFVDVTLISDRSGLVMERGAKVRLRGLEVGRVASVSRNPDSTSVHLEMYPDQIGYIPANIGAQITATTVFGAKYVDLIYPQSPSRQRLSAGTILRSANVTVEVNTIFQNLVSIIDKVDPAKLNAVLSALADGVRGQGQAIGQATTDANEVLLALNPRMDTVAEDFRSLRGFADTYGAAAQDLLATLKAATTTSATLTARAADLDALLTNVIGFSEVGSAILSASGNTFVAAANTLRPTTDLLYKYNPTYTCLLQGAAHWLDNGGYENLGGNGKSGILDGGILLGSDQYRYPDNLPIIAAKGGPAGKPGCGSLPDVSKQFPVRQLITNTGFGTGQDIRTNPGIGFPGWANYFPVTRAVPEPPSIKSFGGPAPGPMPPLTDAAPAPAPAGDAVVPTP